jgi:hypothetical protein
MPSDMSYWRAVIRRAFGACARIWTRTRDRIEAARLDRAMTQEEAMRSRVDALLARIHDQGYERLSTKEKKYLRWAGRRIRAVRTEPKGPGPLVPWNADEPPAGENVEERVDLLLEKINRHGQASLTREERQFLQKASARFRKKISGSPG